MSDKEIRLAVCVPSLGDWEEQFGECLTKLLMFCAQHPFPGHPQYRGITLYKRRGSLIPLLREGFFEDCKIGKDTHCLMLDCDQTFPPDTAHRLLAHEQPVVAANVATKVLPSAPTARTFNGTEYGQACYTGNKHGLEKVWRVGAAVMLVDMAVIPKLGRGLFEVVWNPATEQYRGEDWSFCKKCQDNDVPVMIDHDLSRQVGHIGTYIYTHRDVFEPKQAKAA